MTGGKARRSVGIVGVPTREGQPRGGTETGPEVIRHGGIVKRLEAIGCDVTDCGDVEFDFIENDTKERHVKNPRNVAMTALRTADSIAKALQSNRTVIALGGDHSMAIGTILGHARARPDMAVLWIDAHADINTPLTSGSGNIHGMPISFLARELEGYLPKLPGWEDIKPCMSLKNLAYIGLRDVDHGERKIIEEFGITAFSMHEVETFGIHECVTRALKSIDPEGTRPLHVSFDVDSMEPSLCPSTGTPVIGGLTLRELFHIGEEVQKTGRLSVIDIAEVNPRLGNEDDVRTTVKSAIDVMDYFFGSKREGTYPFGYKVPLPSSERMESR